SGVMLGRYWGGASQALYVLIGVVGVPWFAGGASGVEVMFGATGGYLVGFVLASLLVGELTERKIEARSWKTLFPLMAAGSLVILFCGSIGLVVILGLSFSTALLLGFVPFVAVDLIKSLLVGGTASFLSTKRHYGPEA
ncbi:MAG: biotin transporter BioY, partial [Thermoplasmata archaeon]|nr:biotin transporter BioY [Thermoplasmata archaeon]